MFCSKEATSQSWELNKEEDLERPGSRLFRVEEASAKALRQEAVQGLQEGGWYDTGPGAVPGKSWEFTGADPGGLVVVLESFV